MVSSPNSGDLNFDNFNLTVYELAMKLDKCLFIVIGCGFSLNDLLAESKNNLYVQIMN
jgi:hypothetical protein